MLWLYSEYGTMLYRPHAHGWPLKPGPESSSTNAAGFHGFKLWPETLETPKTMDNICFWCLSWVFASALVTNEASQGSAFSKSLPGCHRSQTWPTSRPNRPSGLGQLWGLKVPRLWSHVPERIVGTIVS